MKKSCLFFDKTIQMCMLHSPLHRFYLNRVCKSEEIHVWTSQVPPGFSHTKGFPVKLIEIPFLNIQVQNDNSDII